MNSTILDVLADADLKAVRKMIYYDCLYRDDSPKPGKNTFHAMQKVLKNSPNAKIVIYEMTGEVDPTGSKGGTPKRPGGKDFWTDWPDGADPNATNNVSTTVNNLKATQDSNALLALNIARLVQGALGDGYFDRPWFKATFKPHGALLIDLIDAPDRLHSRGSYASSAALAKAKNKLFVGDWVTADEAIKIKVLATRFLKEILNNKQHLLMAWGGPDPAESISGLLDIVHDNHVPEFAWEHLLG